MGESHIGKKILEYKIKVSLKKYDFSFVFIFIYDMFIYNIY